MMLSGETSLCLTSDAAVPEKSGESGAGMLPGEGVSIMKCTPAAVLIAMFSGGAAFFGEKNSCPISVNTSHTIDVTPAGDYLL